MVIGILKSGLQHVMVDITDREFRPDPGDPKGFKLEISHGASGILRESLVNSHPNHFMRHQSSTDQMRFKNFLNKIFTHGFPFQQSR
jgi:hypothetical protein